MKRDYFSSSIEYFCVQTPDSILGMISNEDEFNTELSQKSAWKEEIALLHLVLKEFKGHISFEFSVPRMGKRIDVLLIIQGVIFILEFKVGERNFNRAAIDQVLDYALDLKNFHETSHNLLLVPILVATESKTEDHEDKFLLFEDNIISPLKTNGKSLPDIIHKLLDFSKHIDFDIDEWKKGRYSPTPTIIEAAISLYNKHSVENITRSEAKDLTATTAAIDQIVNKSKNKNEKAICFVTGVPGAGKTLAGLNIATTHLNKETGTTSVFLSGNGPLVAVLREALTRDKYYRDKVINPKVRKGQILQEVKLFIQNVHHFRDEYYFKDKTAPVDHVAIFDEAQRAWNKEQTTSFMKRRKGVKEFNQSEPEFLISCLDRHQDWAVILCLVGGGQEINTGEAGITEWINSISRRFPHWKIYMADNLSDSEYSLNDSLSNINPQNVYRDNDLHLAVSMRSFRAENLSRFVKCVLDFEVEEAKNYFMELNKNYPIVLSRDLNVAKEWIKKKARGTERYGVVVSSQAERLKPLAIDVKSPLDPINWFLNDKDDVRSSFYLEDAATEFHVQGLELDWTCVTWDADFRYNENSWDTYSFKGKRWERILKEERKKYLKNAYRVLLTRARQGMILVVPNGSDEDPTRKSEFYDSTYQYLKSIGLEVI
jgi:hypothetical protein